jgi:hypothetical protein
VAHHGHLGHLQEPLESNPAKLESPEFLENTTLVNFGIVSNLSAFYERTCDGVIEVGKNGPNPLQACSFPCTCCGPRSTVIRGSGEVTYMHVCVHLFVLTGIASSRCALHFTTGLTPIHTSQLNHNEVYATHLAAFRRSLDDRRLHLPVDGASCLFQCVGLSLIVMKITRVINAQVEYESTQTNGSNKRTVRVKLST